MIYLGIDPGQKGGVAYICSKTRQSYVVPMPDIFEFNFLIDSWNIQHGIVHCFLEKAQAMPKQGVTSMFSYGQHFGQLQGVLVSHSIPFTLVKPQEWQKEMFKGSAEKTAGVKKDPKERALEIVRRMFPKEKFLATMRCKKPHDGMIDSILLAEFCRRKII